MATFAGERSRGLPAVRSGTPCVLLCILMLGGSRVSGALDPALMMTQYQHSRWGVDEGLREDAIGVIAQTRDGYIWIGSSARLIRFDGDRFTEVLPARLPEIGRQAYTALVETPDGSLWCATAEAGVVRKVAGSFERITIADGLPSNLVHCLHAGTDGVVWAGTDRGLCRIGPDGLVTYSSQHGLASTEVIALAAARGGGLWIATNGGGVYRLKDSDVIPLAPRHGEIPNKVLSILEDRDGALWIGTVDRGLWVVRDDLVRVYTARDGLPHDVVTAIFQDRNGNVWAGSHLGICVFDGGRFIALGSDEAPSGAFISTIVEDAQGGLWYGTHSGELHCLCNGRFTPVGRPEGLSHDLAGPILEDSDGTTWIGTQGGGLNRLPDGHVDAISRLEDLRAEVILSLCQDTNGRLWVGTRDTGLYMREGKRFRRFTTADGLPSDTIPALCTGADGDLWVGTRRGLARITRHGIEVVGGTAGSAFLSLHYQSRQGILWAGTGREGLLAIGDQVRRAFAVNEGLHNAPVFSIYEDRDATLWLGTDGGLARLKNGTVTTFTSRNGLLSDTIFCVLEDSSGNLWMTSSNGILRVSKRELDAVAGGVKERFRCESFGRADGMRTISCVGEYQPAGCTDKAGRLWFPTNAGAVVLDPASQPAGRTALQVFIEEVEADGRAVGAARPVVLPPGTKSVALRYTAPSFPSSARPRLRHFLEGVDAGWVEAGAHRSAMYANLRPGRYVFRVETISGDGARDRSEAALVFRLSPYFYQTYWFRISCLIAAVMAAVWVHRLRMMQVEAKAALLRERTRMARDLHDTLAQELSGLLLHLRAADTPQASRSADSAQSASHLQSLVGNCIDQVHNIVWELTDTTADRVDLVALLRGTLSRRSPLTRAAVDLDVVGTPKPVPGRTAAELLAIAGEALVNATRHSGASRIAVAIEFAAGMVVLTVRDDGCGFRPDAVRSGERRGFGIRGMRERAELLRGELTVRSVPAGGTLVTASIPVRERSRWWGKA